MPYPIEVLWRCSQRRSGLSSIRWHNRQVLQGSYGSLFFVRTLLFASCHTRNLCFGMMYSCHTTVAHAFLVLCGLEKSYAVLTPCRNPPNQLSSSWAACWTEPADCRIWCHISCSAWWGGCRMAWLATPTCQCAGGTDDAPTAPKESPSTGCSIRIWTAGLNSKSEDCAIRSRLPPLPSTVPPKRWADA